jgi:hypothetical protein
MSMWRIEILALALLAGCGGKATKTDNDEPAPPPTAPQTESGKGGATAALTAAKQNFAVDPVWVAGPAVRPDNELDLRFYSDSHKMPAKMVDDVAVKTWMPEMGHPGPMKKMTVERDAADRGLYHVKNLDLFMTGLWQLTITASADGASDSAVLELRL